MASKGEYLDTAVERSPINTASRSGASVERVLLADGRRLVVKRITPADGLIAALTGDTIGREYMMWSRGILDQLPAAISHAVVDGWLERESAVIVMDDLGDALVGSGGRLNRDQCRVMLESTGQMYRAFLGRAPDDLTPLPLAITLFAPQRMRMYVGCGNPLPDVVLRGWEAFDDVMPNEVGAAILDLLTDPGPLVGALLALPCTLVHGDLATANMAIRGGKLTMIDWAVPAAAPAALDLAWMLARSASGLDLPREEVLAEFARCAGPATDDLAIRLALLAGLMTWGWSKALDATQHPELAVRQREWVDLDWWAGEARRTLEAALI